MEYAVQSNVIRGLSKEEHRILIELCQYSNNLYNVALYNIRQYFFNQKKFLTYESNYHECKDNENYELLQAGVAQADGYTWDKVRIRVNGKEGYMINKNYK